MLLPLKLPPRTHRTNKTPWVPLGPHRANRHIGDRIPARSALGLVQPQMAPLAVRVSLVDDEVVRLPLSVTLVHGSAGRTRLGWVEEGIAAFRAEEVELVVEPLAEDFVVEGDEARVDDGRAAVVAPMGEALGLATVAAHRMCGAEGEVWEKEVGVEKREEKKT